MTAERFDLDKSIAAWRRTLEHLSAMGPEDLDELEQHVRDQVSSLSARGRSKQAAFEHAMREMGAQETAADEYGKVYVAKQRMHGQLRCALAARVARARNYLSVAARTAWRQKGTTFMSAGGLAVGLATCLLVGIFAQHELTFDRFHERADEIYRVAWGHDLGGSALLPALGAERLGEVSEVDEFVRIHPASVVVRRGDVLFTEDQFYYADGSFFELFTFPLIAGDPARVLQAPNSIVLSESASQRYFGEVNPVGETLVLQNGTTLEVTGIARDAPSNSQLQFDVVASYQTLGDAQDWTDSGRGWTYQSWLYLAFSNESDVRRFQSRVRAITSTGMGAISSAFGLSVQDMYFELQPLRDIRLHPSPSGAIRPEGDIRYVYIFAAVGLLVLIIAVGNYVNLATAGSLQRAREVGVRKVLGANRAQLMGQFYCEASLICGAAFVIALTVAIAALQPFETLHGAEIDLESVDIGHVVALTAGLAAITALTGGLYPAVILSGFSPFSSFQRTLDGRGSGAVRKGLVIFQFALSSVLIIGTVVVYAQMEYVRNARLGYNTAQIIKLPIPTSDENMRFSGSAGAATQNRGRILKDAFLQTPGVERVSISSGFPVEYITGMADLDGQPFKIHYVSADPDYVETMGMELVAGMNFLTESTSDLPRGVVVNETMARVWELDSRVGELLDTNLAGRERRLLGIVSDFHTGSLHQPIDPTVLLVEPEWFHAVVLRLDGERLTAALAAVRDTWQRLEPDQPFEPEYLDSQIEQLYESEQRLARMIGLASSLAILTACLGLFSLTALTIEQRKKEIGVRKVLGASVTGIVRLLATDVVRLAGIAFILAAPVAYFAMRRWLEEFAYRIDLAWWIFVVAGVLTVAIALLTVSYQSWKAALADPVRNLRHE
jgi:putative ABC transport system permease protein